MKLKSKVMLVFIPLALVTCALIVTLERRAIHRILIDELAQRVLGRTSDFSSEAAAALEKHGENLMLVKLHSFIEQTQASYAVVIDTAGLVVAHTNVVEQGKIYRDDATLAAMLRQQSGYVVGSDGVRRTLDITIPLWEKSDDFLISSEGGRRRIGTLRIGLPLDDALLIETRIVRQLYTVLGFSGGGALILLLLLTRRMLKPIQPLNEAAAQISRGRYGVTVPILSRDELGELADNFNRMSFALSETTVSKRFLDDILNGMLDTLIVLNADGKVRLSNAAAGRLLGRTSEELAGLHETQLIGLRRQKCLGGSAEVDMLSAAGEEIPVLLSTSEMFDEAGRNVGLVLVARDIRERKSLESRMAQSEKLSAIGQLAAGVAHEINNPLGVILGFAQNLNRKFDDDDPLALPLRSISREALRCKELVQNLLTFSRHDRKTLEPVALTGVVANALLLIEAQARIRGITLNRELGSEDMIVSANSNQIQQIIINLCNNAMDATPQGGTVTVLCASRLSDGRRWARIEIRDTGTGIPAAIRQKIFDPFFTTKDPGKGTGLGLSLVYELVSHHHGLLDFKSTDGRGTSFFVDLPLAAIGASGIPGTVREKP